MSKDETIRTIIVDTDEQVHEEIEQVLSHYKEFDLIRTCSSGAEAVEAIRRHMPDLVFLETSLADMSGFEVIQKAHPVHTPEFVFVTASKKDAVKAFEFFAFDYVIKPLAPERLHLTLLKVKEALSRRKGDHLQEKLNALFRYVSSPNNSQARLDTNGSAILPVKMAGRIYFVKIEDVQYIEASGYYIEIFANGKKHLMRQSLRGMAEKLDKTRFIRIHRSVIINIRYLKEIVKYSAGDFSALMENGASFRISKSYKNQVFQKIGIRS